MCWNNEYKERTAFMNKPNNRRTQETNETIIRAAFVLLVEEK